MKQEDIELAFKKVNQKLLAQLEPEEKQQAIEEFKLLYEGMPALN